jgi:hypothetical protein
MILKAGVTQTLMFLAARFDHTGYLGAHRLSLSNSSIH